MNAILLKASWVACSVILSCNLCSYSLVATAKIG
jgi:hypothetical protein